MQYREEIVKAMGMLASHDNTVFLGQGVRYAGHALFGTLEDAKVPMEKRIEMPVAEDMQMGMSIGLSLMGYVPISIYPRMDFLITAMNQLVNHLDKMVQMSNGQYRPSMIIRTSVGSKNPLDGGIQHTGNYTELLMYATKNIGIYNLSSACSIRPAYEEALSFANSDWRIPSILIEYADLYKE